MTFLPIVERELRVASRRSGTYWLRAQVALSALIPVLVVLIGPGPFMAPSQMGAEMFQILAYLAFFFTIISAVRLTADCISSEKREGTLGLLFLTDLKPRDVIIGKLSATSLNAFYGLVALLPVLAIPLMLGGVTFGDLARLTLVLLNTLFFALAVSMFVSVLSWQERQAMGLTTILLSGFCIGLPMVGGFVAAVNGLGQLAPWFVQASPGYACAQIRSSSYVGAAGAFWFSSAVTHGLGWLFFGLACWRLPSAWQDGPSEGLLKRWRNWCRDLVMGSVTSRAVFRRAALRVNPIFWLASRERRMVWYPWILLGSVAAIAVIGCRLAEVRGVAFWPLLVSTFFLNWFFKHWMINFASQAFAVDRDKGALELLLSTPLTLGDVLKGHRLALSRVFLAPVVVMVLIELALFVMAVAAPDDGRDRFVPGFAMIVSLLVFLADSYAAGWVSWWCSAVSKSASSAVTSVYLRLMIGPWVAVGFVVILIYLFEDTMNADIVFGMGVLAWAGVSLLLDFHFVKSSRRNLLSGLRVAAVERYGGADAGTLGWRQLGRALGRWWAGKKRGAPSPGAA